MIDDRRTRLAVAVHEVHHARRQAGLVDDLGKCHRGERRELRGLQHDGVAARQRRRDLPRQHEQREIPRDDLADDADRLVAGELRIEQLGPARVVVEVACRERHVDVARLADRLAVVHRFEHREQARVFLDPARDRVQVAGPRVGRQRLPCGKRLLRRADRGIHIILRAIGDARDHLRRRRVDDVERLSGPGPGAADVVPEGAVVFAEPGERFLVALRRGAVLHRLEDLCDCGHGQGIG